MSLAIKEPIKKRYFIYFDRRSVWFCNIEYMPPWLTFWDMSVWYLIIYVIFLNNFSKCNTTLNGNRYFHLFFFFSKVFLNSLTFKAVIKAGWCVYIFVNHTIIVYKKRNTIFLLNSIVNLILQFLYDHDDIL